MASRGVSTGGILSKLLMIHWAMKKEKCSNCPSKWRKKKDLYLCVCFLLFHFLLPSHPFLGTFSSSHTKNALTNCANNCHRKQWRNQFASELVSSFTSSRCKEARKEQSKIKEMKRMKSQTHKLQSTVTLLAPSQRQPSTGTRDTQRGQWKSEETFFTQVEAPKITFTQSIDKVDASYRAKCNGQKVKRCIFRPKKRLCESTQWKSTSAKWFKGFRITWK